jgi:hypothetical protein
MKSQLFGVVAIATIAAGCSSSSSADVTVKTSEWIFEQSTTTVKAGNVKFRVDNVGGAEHELVVVRAAEPSALPTKADGTVDEEKLTDGRGRRRGGTVEEERHLKAHCREVRRVLQSGGQGRHEPLRQEDVRNPHRHLTNRCTGSDLLPTS